MGNIFQNLSQTIGFTDILDIILVALLVYGLIHFIQETRAWQVAKGIAIFLLATLFAQWFHLYTLHWILSGILTIGAIALVVLFQPELRSLLAKLGRTKFLGLGKELSKEQADKIIQEVSTAVKIMSDNKIGGILIFEGADMLNDILSDGGTILNADISDELIRNIFYVGSPLHDGAMIIRGDKIYAAGCVLPLAKGKNLPKDLGTRHRAAVGITESCDAFVIVVSEETGTITICQEGKISRFTEIEKLKRSLRKIYKKDEKKTLKGFLKGVKNEIKK